MQIRQGLSVKNNPCQVEQSPHVILSPFASLRVNSAKGLARWAARSFAALRMTGLVLSGIAPLHDVAQLKYWSIPADESWT